MGSARTSSTESVRPPYPPEFLWGVATAGYQVEGGFNDAAIEGAPRNNWHGVEVAGKVERTGAGVRFWDRWREDIALARGLGVNAFRVGVEWARVEPTATSGFDTTALDRYADMLAAMREAGMEPVVTLQHFTHPAWLGTDPWLDRATAPRFARYATELASALGRRLAERGQPPVRWWVTVNEPNSLCMATYYLRVFPRGPGTGGARDLSRALAGILAAHVHARRALHDAYAHLGWAAPTVTYNAWACAVYAIDRYLIDLLRPTTRAHTRELRRAFNRERGRVGLLGNLVDFVLTRAVKTAAFAPLVAELGADEDALDVLGLDYYHPFLGDYVGWRGAKTDPWQWPMQAARMPAFVAAWIGPHRDRPLYLLEHGIAKRPAAVGRGPAGTRWRPDGLDRVRALDEMIGAVDQCLARGLDVRGYFHWSLVDNYEWGSFAPRFGLYGVDRDDDARRMATDRAGLDAAGAYRDLIAARAVGVAPSIRSS